MGLKILVVDDEVDLVTTCARFLERLGYRCLKAFSAARAIELLVSEEPDLVMTDLQLPDKSGLEIAHHVRSTRPGVPVILTTAYDVPETADAALQAGATLYMPKPFALNDLAKAIFSMLSHGKPDRHQRASDG